MASPSDDISQLKADWAELAADVTALKNANVLGKLEKLAEIVSDLTAVVSDIKSTIDDIIPAIKGQ